MSSDTIRVGEYEVSRAVLDEIGRELREYHHRRRRYEYLRLRYQQLPLESPDPPDGVPGATGPGNPTLRAVERMDAIQTEMAELAAWIVTVDNVIADLPEGTRELLTQLYLLPKSAREYTIVGLARRLNMSEREAYRCRNEGLLEIGLATRGRAILSHPPDGWQKCGRNMAESWQVTRRNA